VPSTGGGVSHVAGLSLGALGLDRAALGLDLADVGLGGLQFGALFHQRLLAIEHRRPCAVFLVIETFGGVVRFLHSQGGLEPQA